MALFHSAQGCRLDVGRWADRLRGAGHGVWTRDLYDGVEAWPADVPVQLHYAPGDRLVDTNGEADPVHAVRSSGSPIEVYTYPGSGHLFADSDGVDYDEASAALMLRRALELLSAR